MDVIQSTPAILPALLAPELEPLFWRPARIGYDSAWTAHVPFAHWIVGALRPRMLVELGTHNGVSYAAFCEAVLRARLDTRCYAVDTWAGDEHAGHYGEEIYADLRRFHDRRYAAFSDLLRCTFDAALPYMPDGAIDLLHIDGCHGYDAVRHDFASWRPKLSDRAVVLLHDTNVRERQFGVWQLFAELREQFPAFEFLHEHGLGVLAVGAQVPGDVAGLCNLRDPETIGAVRERFSQLGERWRFEVHVDALSRELDARNQRQHELDRERETLRREADELARMRSRAAHRAAEARRAASQALFELERTTSERDRARGASGLTRALLAQARDEVRIGQEAAAALAQFQAAPPPEPPRADGATLAGGAESASLAEATRPAGWRSAVALSGQLPHRLRRALHRRLRLRADRKLLVASPLFDAGWYLARYPDVAASGIDPALHYLRSGSGEQRDPGPQFDGAWYRAAYPDVAASDVPALIHYLRHGVAEGRLIRPLLNPSPAPAAPASPEPRAASPAPAAPAAPAALPAPSATAEISRDASASLRIVYVLGAQEADTPGRIYRTERPGEAARALGAEVTWIQVEHASAHREAIRAADIVVIWRTAWSPITAQVVNACRQTGARMVFDVDDLMIEPELARTDIIDGIRTQAIPVDAAREHYARVRDTMAQADFCIATTDELAWYMRRHGKPTFVLPNGFDRETWARSRLLARARRAGAQDATIRLGYALGSRTHQKDFAVAAAAVARVLRERPACRLVLFTSHIDLRPVLDIAEIPELAGLEDRIEWRPTVPLADLPAELARFDVNLAPLEVGNPFCEAKSELKFFEAALVGVPTVASSTGPFMRAIAHGRTGFLARDTEGWYRALMALVDDAALRRRMAHAAYLEVLWPFGPERRLQAMACILDQVRGGARAARAFALDAHLSSRPRPGLVLPESEVMFESDALRAAEVTVVVPLYNYAQHVVEALDSVRAQTLGDLDLIVIDDRSTDASLPVALAWARANAARFNRLLVLRNATNAGLGATRNAGFAAAETPYVLPLDADNRLRPPCAERLLAAAREGGAAFVYPVIQEFGDTSSLMGIFPYAAQRLVGVPFVDAMALVSVAAWASVGGYWDGRHGWEDYEFWCRLAEQGLHGEQVAGPPLADYRVHRASMLRSVTEASHVKPVLMAEMKRRHPWLSLVYAKPDAGGPPQAPQALDGLAALLPLLRCPVTGQALSLDAAGGALVTPDGAQRWAVVQGRPVLFPGMAAPVLMPEQHLSHALPDVALALMREADGPVLNLSAGGTDRRLPHVIELETAIFRNTGVVGDAHALPFADGMFAAVVVLNAFEHYRDPPRVAAEILRVLRPGGRVLVRTAFLQPLHEAPAHYFNCTRYGLQVWFERFETEALHVSDNFSPAHGVAWLAHDMLAALRDAQPDAARRFAEVTLGRLAQSWTDGGARAALPAWRDLAALPQAVQERFAAGFEFVGRKPDA